MITTEEIKKLAALARIELSETETEGMQKDIGEILAYVDTIKAAPVPRVSLGKSAIRNVMREDAHPHESGIFTEKLLAVVPKREGNYICVKKIL